MSRDARRRGVGAGLPWAVGLGATLLTAGAWSLGWLDGPEGALLDARLRLASSFTPPASDAIVHVDIDQGALTSVGRWPWPRERLAMAIDTLTEAGARTIVLDLLLDDPQEARYRPRLGGGFELVRDDDALSDAIARSGRVVQGVSISETGDEPEVRPPSGRIGDGAAAWGFVNVRLAHGETVVRRLDAAREASGERLLQLGVVGAAHYLGLDPAGVGVGAGSVGLGDRSLALRRGRLVVPWRSEPGGEGDPAWLAIHEHVSIGPLVQLQIARRERREAVGVLLGSGPLGAEPTPAQLRDARDAAAFVRETSYPGEDMGAVLARLEARLEREPSRALADERDYAGAMLALERIDAMDPGLGARMDGLREVLDGKLVFVGWIATGAIADFYPTAMGARTPGVTIHAAIAEGALTGHWIAQAPWWADLLALLALGAAGTAAAGSLSPGRSWGAALVAGGGYLALNAAALFDAGDLLVAGAAPLAALALAWAAGTTARAVLDRKEKAVIRRQFRSRVSPQLVDYLLAHPEQMNMEGEERELTSMFTDFAGFTAISEKLEARRTVALLNTTLRAMTDRLLEEDAYVNKFLGDGIMAFWGAPAETDRHADRAVRAAIGAFGALEETNASLAGEGLPALGMRVGLSTGRVVVGDCGAPPTLRDYTVIGDAVNLAARLESANKMLGTSILATRRTIDLLADETRAGLMLRPLGPIRVVGQQQASEVVEVVAPPADPGERARLEAWIADTARALEAFGAGDFEAAMDAWRELVLFERGQAGAMLFVQRCAELIDAGGGESVLPLRGK